MISTSVWLVVAAAPRATPSAAACTTRPEKSGKQLERRESIESSTIVIWRESEKLILKTNIV